ncbi:hypothetical protein PVAND_015746 [Polypedilum vanderplanki]|uniref:Glycosyltransferase family 92 protein n=1 Tax=Polypedilum vanderplanki TaxID=319348 RepID=A0A9J6BDV5_POLVA|nr:hypothetical protein PVAND_015746 [Polypedilum vanderplanki]
MRIRRVKIVQIIKWLIIFVPTFIATVHFFKLHDKINARKKYLSENLHVDKHNQFSQKCLQTISQLQIQPMLNIFQPFFTKNVSFLLFNAYYDNRKALKNLHQIRILIYVTKFEFTAEIYCQFWYENQKLPKISKVKDFRLIWNKNWDQNINGLSPYLLSCEVDENEKDLPTFVSLVESPCDNANNKLKIINDETEEKKNFLVCVKGMKFYDVKMALILTEWIEIVKILGADKILFYVIDVGKEFFQILKHYELKKFAEIIEIKFPLQNLNKSEEKLQEMMHDLIAYNDCFYRNVNNFKFLVPIDVDEFIMPIIDKSWMELLSKSKNSSTHLYPNETFDAFAYRNAFFLLTNNHADEIQSEVPENFHFLQHIYRAANHNENSKHTKAFMEMENILTVHNHMPLECFENGKCKTFLGDRKTGQVQHYREKCENYKECDDYTFNTVRDDNLWRFKDEIINGVYGAIREIFGDDSLLN